MESGGKRRRRNARVERMLRCVRGKYALFSRPSFFTTRDDLLPVPTFHSMKISALVFTFAISAAHGFVAATDDADRAALLKDVSEISTGGVPGGVCAFGPTA